MILTLLLTLFATDQEAGIDQPSPEAASPSPFGWDLGGSTAGLTCPKVLDVYQCVAAPSPVGGFDLYLLLDIGGFVGEIRGIGTAYENDAHGYKVRARFGELRTALVEKYGDPSSDYDFLAAGSIWDDPQYWAIGILKGERFLASFWIDDDDVAITLTAAALSSSMTYLTLSYQDNDLIDSRNAAAAQQDAGGL